MKAHPLHKDVYDKDEGEVDWGRHSSMTQFVNSCMGPSRGGRNLELALPSFFLTFSLPCFPNEHGALAAAPSSSSLQQKS